MFIVDYLKGKNRSPKSSLKKSQSSDTSDLMTQNFSVTRKISQNRFPVYQVSLKLNSQDYAMKLYSYKECRPHPYYQNEIRFSSLKHPNIINMISHGEKRDAPYKGQLKTFSYVLMEYAPYGDFFDLLTTYGDRLNEKIIRTYFRQLIEGIEYLQANHIAHLDLKPENLLLSADLKLKISDFDLSYIEGDSEILGKGTDSYRGPEIFMAENPDNIQLRNPFAADIYSAAIILFALKTGGVYPYFENKTLQGIDFLKLMNNNDLVFWEKHSEIQEKPISFFDNDFVELFNGMTRSNPDQRFTIQKIKKSKWYNGPIYSTSKLQRKMKKILNSEKMCTNI